MPTAQVYSGESDRLSSALVSMRAETGLPMTFGGPVVRGRLQLREFSGNTTTSLSGLSILPGSGLGGRALSLRRPIAVRDYANTAAISHEYDRAVGAEGLRSLLAVPVIVTGEVRAVVYGALRQAVPLGDRAMETVVAAGRRLERALAGDDETRRKLVAVPVEGPTEVVTGVEREEIRKIFADLRTLATQVDDVGVRAQLYDACERFVTASHQGVPVAERPYLTPREIEALAHAAVGCSNAEIAMHLGVTVETAKSYLRDAMQKFGVHGRHAAVSAARSVGYLP